MITDTDWERIARMLTGEGDAAEAAATRAWIAADPARAAAVEDARRALAAQASVLVRGAPAVDVDAAWARVAPRLDVPRATTPAAPRLTVERGLDAPPARPAWARRLVLAGLAAAAGIVGVLALRATGEGEAGAFRTLATTAAAVTDTVRLPDGSTVVLAPESRLAMRADFGQGGRTLRLEGEAWFDVVHDDASPFVVQAGSAEARDVGTAFTVTAREGAPTVVAVEEGVVELRAVAGAPSEAVRLEAGDLGMQQGTQAPRATHDTLAVKRRLAWTHGELTFSGATLAEVAGALRRWRGLDVRVDSALAGRRLDASFRDEPDSTVLAVIAGASGARLVRANGTVRLVPAGTP